MNWSEQVVLVTGGSGSFRKRLLKILQKFQAMATGT